MLDVRIRQCRLRVVRHGGWSWGADRARLIDMASKQVPALIADWLEQLEFAEPSNTRVDKLTVRLRCQGDALSRTGFVVNPALAEQWRSSLSHQLREQIAMVSPLLLSEKRGQLQEPTVPPPMAASKASITQLLRLWRNQGSLSHHLNGFSLPALTNWEQAWLRIRHNQTRGAIKTPGRMAAQADALLRILPDYGNELRGIRQARLHLLVELDFHAGGRLHVDEAAEQLARLLPLTDVADNGTPAVSQQASIDTSASRRISLLQPRNTLALSRPQDRADRLPMPPFPSRNIDTHVASALPYLVLGSLAQLGFLQALSATLDSAGASSSVHCLSAALAIKLLPMERQMDGQARRHVITTCSLIEQVPGPQAFARFEAAFGPLLSAADAGIHAALLRGHEAAVPLLIQERKPGWVLFDTQGVFPLMVIRNSETLKRTPQLWDNAVVLVPKACASSILMDTLLAAGGAFLTDAEPVKNEPWVALDRARRFHFHRDHPVASSLARRFDVSQRTATAWLEEHLPARRVLPEYPGNDLDTSAELAAGAALADLAHVLWSDREATHPLLAYRRLHDLEARVRIDAERVRVSLALGQRYFDLRDKGLLQDVAGVPWLGGRTLMFSGL